MPDRTHGNGDFEETVRRSVAWMRERREAEARIGDLAARDPEFIARGLILLAQREHTRLHRELRERFGFTAAWGREGLVCRFDEPKRVPKTPEQAARWTDLLVHLIAHAWAVREMRRAAEYHPDPDRARVVCNAFLDAMRQMPALYGAFAEADFRPAVREHAAAVLAAWTRSHLRRSWNPRLRRALQSEGWERELVNAAYLAWRRLDPGAPMKRSTRFRDATPWLKQRDGRRPKAPGPPDFVNLVSAVLGGRDIAPEEPDEPKELELAQFANREQMLQDARDTGLTPREMELYEFYLEHPNATYRQAAEHFGRSIGWAKKLKSRIDKTLGAV
jgi:hypothetical protein